jgi:putative thioredoxin
MQPRNNMSLRGAVDLAAVKAAADAATKAEQLRAERARKAEANGADAAAEPLIFAVTEADFQAQVIPLSAEVPVLLLFWAEGYGPAEQQVPVMEALAEEYDGRFVLAEVDVRDNQRLAQQLQLRDLPTVLVVVAGQLIPLFEGPALAEEIRPLLDQLIKEAAERFGVAGEPGTRSGKGEPGLADDAEVPQDPALALAHDALDAGDLGGAIQAYRNVLAEQPGNEEAKLGLAQAELLQRVQGLDPAAARSAAAEKPSDVEAQIAAADLDLVGGHVDDAFGRLVDTVGRTFGEERDTVRLHLLSLFEVIGAEDPRVVKARSALARKLF